MSTGLSRAHWYSNEAKQFHKLAKDIYTQLEQLTPELLLDWIDEFPQRSVEELLSQTLPYCTAANLPKILDIAAESIPKWRLRLTTYEKLPQVLQDALQIQRHKSLTLIRK
jgi:hypothetical protein